MEVKAYGNAWYVIGRCRDFCCEICPAGHNGKKTCGSTNGGKKIVFRRKLIGVTSVNGMNIGAKTQSADYNRRR